MTLAAVRADGRATSPRVGPASDAAYAPGRCNIGKSEIERRRRFGHLGVAIAIVLFAALVATDAPREWRLLLFFPAAGGAIGYLQAGLRFCAAFGLLGIFNFGRLGDARRVGDPAHERRDQLMALAIAAGSAVAGLGVAMGAYLIWPA